MTLDSPRPVRQSKGCPDRPDPPCPPEGAAPAPRPTAVRGGSLTPRSPSEYSASLSPRPGTGGVAMSSPRRRCCRPRQGHHGPLHRVPLASVHTGSGPQEIADGPSGWPCSEKATRPHRRSVCPPPAASMSAELSRERIGRNACEVGDTNLPLG